MALFSLQPTVRPSGPANPDPPLTLWRNPTAVLASIPFIPPTRHITLTMDASHAGWGTHLDGHAAQGLWLPREAWMQINILELRAVCFACWAYLPFIHSHRIQPLSNNMTAVVYINKQSMARSSSLCMNAILLWNWSLRHRVTVYAIHLLGTSNSLEDMLSHSFHTNREWELHELHPPIALLPVGHAALGLLDDARQLQTSSLLLQRSPL